VSSERLKGPENLIPSVMVPYFFAKFHQNPTKGIVEIVVRTLLEELPKAPIGSEIYFLGTFLFY